MTETPRFARFDEFTFDLHTLELTRAGTFVPLPPQPARVLAQLLQNAGRLVAREDLRDHLWPDTIVEYEKGLNTAVRQVRDALGDRAAQPTFVETLPRRGYRFMAPVTLSPAKDAIEKDRDASPVRQIKSALERTRPTSRSGVWVTVGALFTAVLVSAAMLLRGPAASAHRILVLPFDNLTSDPELDVLASGLSEEVRANLASLSPDEIGVVARTTAEFYGRSQNSIREMGVQLDVAYVLEGTVHADGDNIGLTTRLIFAGQETPVWQERYSGPPAGALPYIRTVSDRIARSLTNKPSGQRVGAALPAAPTDSALRLSYLKARHFLGRSISAGPERAMEYFNQVLGVEPEFAPALAGLAEARLRTGDPEGARSAAQQALALDSSIAEAHRVLGAVLLTRDYAPDSAGRHFRTALELAPGRSEELRALALYLFVSGESATGLQLVEQASQLDPLSAAVKGDIGIYYYWAGHYDRAEHHCRLATEIDSTQTFGHRCLVNSMAAAGRDNEAAEHIPALMTLEGATAAQISDVVHHVDGALTAYWKWRIRVLEDETQDGPVLLERARLYAAAGEIQLAIACLEVVLRDPPMNLVTVGLDPVFAPLRGDRRFDAVLHRIGFGDS